MRMTHYFGIAALALVPLMIVTALSGALGKPWHVSLGLFGAIFAIGTHTLLILFMIVTGRVLREAMKARDMGPEFLNELNQFFAKKKAYPLALYATLLVVGAGVLGYAGRGFGVPLWVHPLAGTAALFFNLWALGAEYRALAENQVLLDRATARLDELDAASPPASTGPEEQEGDPRSKVLRMGWTLLLGSWLPYLYWGLVVWKGEFHRVSLHPWVEGSALGLLLLLLALPRAKTDEPARREG